MTPTPTPFHHVQMSTCEACLFSYVMTGHVLNCLQNKITCDHPIRKYVKAVQASIVKNGSKKYA